MRNENRNKIYAAITIIALGLAMGLILRFAYNCGVNSGRTFGYADGYDIGYNEGHADGFAKGRVEGYETSEAFLEEMIEYTADSGYFYKEIGDVKYKIRTEKEQ